MSNKKDEAQKPGVKVGMFGRRQWDEEVYKARANERLAREDSGQVEERKRKVPEPPKERQPLRAREESVQLDEIVGRRQEVTAETPIRNAVRKATNGINVDPNQGFHCKVCDCVIKDSISYLDHMNSKGHLAAAGMGTRAVRATVDDVKKMLSLPPPQKSKAKPSARKREEDKLVERIIEEQTELRKKEKKEEEEEIIPKISNRELEQDEKIEPAVVAKPLATKKPVNDEDLMAKMGFSGFSSKKK